MMRVTVFLALLLLCSQATGALELTVRVVNPEGQPLIGVSVVTDVTGVGAVTNDEGIFALPYDDEVTRVTFSSVGYQSRQFNLIDMPDTVVLDPMYYPQEKIVVTADRAQAGITPIAFDNVSQDEIERDYTVGEFPLLLETTPNLYVYADGGSALGYSYIKIRGFDDKRIVTYINSVPLNDPEDHATYFVDLPDFAANVTDIQVQRGVGNSLYGDASFGGALNIVTNSFNRPRKTTLSTGYGVYTSGGKSVSDIYKQSVEYSSGLIDGRWLFGGRFSKQKTGGYRYNSWYEGWSYYYSIARLDPRMTTELHIYGGPMRMHLAYYGVERDDLRKDRRTNPLTYGNTTDNFNQPHYQLHNTYKFNDRMTLSNTLYYIRGKGYYEQFKDDRDYFEYNLTSFSDSSSGNLVRQKWVTKNQVGWNPRLNIKHEEGSHSLGGSFYYFDSDHWGQVVSAQFLDGAIDPTHRYYNYAGKKQVGSIYGQEYYRFSDKLSAQATAQLRYIRYDFDQVKMGAFKGYDYIVDWFFFSPRIGLNYKVTNQANLFANFAVASRTPTDEAIYEADDPWLMPSLEIDTFTLSASGDTLYEFGDPTAKSERLYDFEVGGQYRTDEYAFGVNFFWMDFHYEILPYGGVNESGVPITVNADRSLHTGIELTGLVKPLERVSLCGNFAYNYQRIKKYIGIVEVYDATWNYVGLENVDFRDKKVPGFPDYVGSLTADYHEERFRVTYRARFAGKQYMELLNVDSLVIDPFVVSSLSASYRLRNFLNVGDVTFSARVDNIFDKKYEASGYGWNYGYVDNAGDPVTLVSEAEYFAAAERSFYAQLKLELF